MGKRSPYPYSVCPTSALMATARCHGPTQLGRPSHVPAGGLNYRVVPVVNTRQSKSVTQSSGMIRIDEQVTVPSG